LCDKIKNAKQKHHATLQRAIGYVKQTL